MEAEENLFERSEGQEEPAGGVAVPGKGDDDDDWGQLFGRGGLAASL